MKHLFFITLLLLSFSLKTSFNDMTMILGCPKEIWMQIFDYIGLFKKEFLILVNYKNDSYDQSEKTWATTMHALFCTSRLFSHYTMQYAEQLKKKLVQYFVKGNFFEKKIIPYRPLLLMLKIWKNLDNTQTTSQNITKLEQLRMMSDLLVMCRSGSECPHEESILKKLEINCRNKIYFLDTIKYHPNCCLPIKISLSDEHEDNIWCFLFFAYGISQLNTTINQNDLHNSNLKKLFLHNGTYEDLFSKMPHLRVLYAYNTLLPDIFVVRDYFVNLRSLEIVDIRNQNTLCIDLRESNVRDIIVKNIKGIIFLPKIIRFIRICNNLSLKKIINPILSDNTNIKKCIFNTDHECFSHFAAQKSYKTLSIESLKMSIKSNLDYLHMRQIKTMLDEAKSIGNRQITYVQMYSPHTLKML